MSKRSSKHTLNERIEVVLRVMEGSASVSRIAEEYAVDRTTINLWVRKYKADGVDGLKDSRAWKGYSSELKREAVEYYLNGEGSLRTTCEKFNISSHSVLRHWINQYTSGKKIKSTSKGRG
ncbi:helix-turn-helix domain-containing protein, partial [Compostibacillus humi]|uniref:helix-turn-helix domain-containing protein n=1 Tax=Compostibacillus humi TaxID=1245525 RepID=UPI00166DD2BD